MPGIPPRTRVALLSLGTLLLVSAVAPAPVLGDADDPNDWSIAIPTRGVLDVTWSDGRVFGAVDLGGLLIYEPATDELIPFDTTDGLGSNRTRCVVTSPAGEVWVGTADAGITRIFPDLSTRFLTALPGQLDVRTLAFAGANAYYGGPNGGGRIANGLPERSFRVEDGLVDDDVRAVAARDDAAWFGTGAGVSEFDIQANDLITRNDGLADLDVRAMVVAVGIVYAGTGTGLYQLNESGPSPVWEPVTPPLAVEIVDLAARGDRLVVVGPDRWVWTRTSPGDAWTSQQVGIADYRAVAATVDDADRIQIGGRRVDFGPIGADVTPLFIDLAGAESPVYRQLHGSQFNGLGTDREGGAWVGAFPVDAGVSHWNADGRVIAYMDQESGDAVGGYNNDGWLTNLKNEVLVTRGGDVWVSSFQIGLTRLRPTVDDDPAGATYLHLTENNSPIGMNRVDSMSEDPHGNLWFCAAGEIVEGDFNAGVDILLDPQEPYDPANWVHIRPGNSLLAGEGFYDITFEGDRVVWLTVRGVGVQRYVYGDGLGFDPSTVDQSASWRTIRALPESLIEPNLTGARGVAVGVNGRYWVATKGDGVLSFTYTTGPITGARSYKSDSFGVRLLSDDALSVAVDEFGDTWVATELGLNRIREGGDDPGVAAFTDLQNFLDYELGEDYSNRILRALPGGVPVSLDLSDGGPWLFTVSGRGLSRVDLTPGEAPEVGEEGPAFSIYPNPVRTGDDGVAIAGFEGEAQVEIYDLQGRAIRTTVVSSAGSQQAVQIWGLKTLSGDPVANGLYLVRVIQGGKSASRVLAVER